MKLRDEDFYKKVIGGGYNATEIIDQLVEKHKAWEIFNIDPETKMHVGGMGFGHVLCAELYALSPYAWVERVSKVLQDGIDKHPQWLEKLFHPVAQELYYMKEDATKHFDPKFKEALRNRISINDFSKCIELVEFKDETRRQ